MKPDVAKLRQTILQLAVEGKLVTQDLTDLPADELLKQIIAEKQKLQGNSRSYKKPQLPDLKDTDKPFQVPENWVWVRLGEISTAINDGTHKTPKYVDSGVKFLSIRNITKGYIDLENVKYISKQEHEELVKRCNPQKGDILFCRIGTLGQSKVIDVDEEFSIFVSLGLIKLPSLVDEYYLEKVLNSPYMYDVFKKVRVGGLHTNKLNLRDMPNLPIPLPPLAEQKRIVNKVNELMSLCDELETKSDRFLQLITQLRQSVLKLAFEGKLVEQELSDEPVPMLIGKERNLKVMPPITESEKPYKIPDSWKWERIGGISVVKGGKRVPKEASLLTQPTDHIYIRVTDMVNNGVDTGNLRYIDDATYESISRYTISSDDVYVTIAGTIGRVGTISEELSGSNLTENAAKISAHGLNKQYLVIVLRSNYIQDQFTSRTIQAAQPKLALKRIELTTIPIPPLNEQNRIVKKVDETMALLDDLQSRLVAA